MQFDSPLFLLLFLPLMVVIYYAVPHKYKNLSLLAFSIAFFAWGEPVFCFMLIISIILNHYFGKLISQSEGGNKKLFLILSVVFNLFVAAVFRYAEFLFISLREFISLFWMSKNR